MTPRAGMITAGGVRQAAWLAGGLLLFGAAVAAETHQIRHFSQSDANVYRAAGAMARAHPGMIYSLRLGAPRVPFTYPPFTALLFAAPSSLPFGYWQVALTTAGILLLPAIAYMSLGLAGHAHGAGRAAGALALAAAGLWLEPVQMTLAFGQVNLFLLTLIIADFATPGGWRLKGAGIGIAAGIKLVPLIFIPYLLITGRRRAAVVATATFAATVAVGFAFLPAASLSYWSGKIAKPGDGPQRLVNQSINGLVQRSMHGGAPALAVWAAAALLVCAAGLATAVSASRRGHDLLGIVVCGATGLLASPISWTHHWVWVVPGLALGASRASRPEPGPGPRAWRGPAAGAAIVIGLFGMWPARSGPNGYYDPRLAFFPRGLLRYAPHNYGLEYRWRGMELVLGNYYVLAAIVFVAATACWLAVTRHHHPPDPALTHDCAPVNPSHIPIYRGLGDFSS